MKTNIVEELKTLAIESTTPEAVDLLMHFETGDTTSKECINTVDAFAQSLVAQGAITIHDANNLIQEAKQTNGVQWVEVDPDSLFDEDD